MTASGDGLDGATVCHIEATTEATALRPIRGWGELA